MNLEKLNKSIIILDRAYQGLFLRFLNQHPTINPILMTKTDVGAHLSFSYEEDPTFLLMKELNFSYHKAKNLLKLLPFADTSALPLLQKAMKIIAPCIKQDPYLKRLFYQKKVFLLEAVEDQELKGLLRRNNISFEDILLSDLGIEEKVSRENPPRILYFANRHDQYLYTFSQIRKEILDHPEKKDNIRILTSESTSFYPELFSDLFALPVSFPVRTSLLSNPLVKKKLSQFSSMRAFSFSEEELQNEPYSTIKKLIDEYKIEDFPFDTALVNLTEILQSISKVEKTSDAGIPFLTNYNIDQNSEIYVLNFDDSCFFQVSKDNQALFDGDLAKASLNPSFIRTKLDRRLKENYLKYSNVIYYSRVLQHQSDQIYDSQFIKEYGFQSKIQKVDLSKEKYLDGSFTEKASRFIALLQYDAHVIRSKQGEYLSYDNSFNGKRNDYLSNRKSYSVTDLEKYINCPFQYLYSKILPDQEIDYSKMFYGTLVHAILEKITHPGFDLDKEFDRARAEYLNKLSEKGKAITAKDEAMLELCYCWLSKSIPELQSYYSKILDHDKEHQDSEIPFTSVLRDVHGKEYEFKGKIDKILYTSLPEGTYYFVIDYKTGAESFDPKICFLGKSVQLPFYSYILEQDPEILDRGFTFGGFGIQKPSFSSIKAAIEDKEKGIGSLSGLKEHMKPVGAIKENIEKSFIDPTFCKNIKIAEYNGEPALFFRDGSCYLLKDLYLDSLDGLLRTIQEIEKGHFQIAPTSSDLRKDDKKLACQYCIYNDICYHKAKDGKSYYLEIEDHWKKVTKGGKAK